VHDNLIHCSNKICSGKIIPYDRKFHVLRLIVYGVKSVDSYTVSELQHLENFNTSGYV